MSVMYTVAPLIAEQNPEQFHRVRAAAALALAETAQDKFWTSNSKALYEALKKQVS